jgi:hypothetical protein
MMRREEIRQVQQHNSDLPTATAIRAVPKENRRQHLEVAARAELEAGRGRPFGDAEWRVAKPMMIALLRLLRAWDQPAATNRSQLAEVVNTIDTLPKAA